MAHSDGACSCWRNLGKRQSDFLADHVSNAFAHGVAESDRHSVIDSNRYINAYSLSDNQSDRIVIAVVHAIADVDWYTGTYCHPHADCDANDVPKPNAVHQSQPSNVI